MELPVVKLTKGIHLMHLFYRIDRVRWAQLTRDQSANASSQLATLCERNSAASHPRLATYACVGGKADCAFILYAAELGRLGQMHRDLEHCFPPGVLNIVYSYLSVTELPEYVTTEDDMRQTLIQQERLQPDTEPFDRRMAELRSRHAEYEHYRLYPELPDWEVMAFYPMSKRRQGLRDPAKADGRTRPGWSKVFRKSDPAHHGFDGYRRLGMGRDARGASDGHAEGDRLRNAPRRGERALRRVRTVLHQPAADTCQPLGASAPLTPGV
jgi:chlorite dismutase